MYIQQGVWKHLKVFLERNPLTRGHVNFTSQDINGSLALLHSRVRGMATLDLKDASDRVSMQLITYLYPSRIVRKWNALRSRQVRLPDGRILPLRKFAAMGSALCFPVEALTFWAIAVAYIWKCTDDLSRATSSVYVYGDDIIVPDDMALGVMDALESVALRVNRSKSFIGRIPFRESCGVDGLDGYDVTPCRIGVPPPQRPSDGPALLAWASYASSSLAKGMPNRSVAIENVLVRLVGRIPRTPFLTSYLSIVDPSCAWTVNDYPGAVWDPGACYYVDKLTCVRARKVYSSIEPWWALQNSLLLGAQGDPSLVVARSATQTKRYKVAIPYLFSGDRSS